MKAPGFLDTLQLQFLPLLDVHRRQHAIPDLFALWVVEKPGVSFGRQAIAFHRRKAHTQRRASSRVLDFF